MFERAGIGRTFALVNPAFGQTLGRLLSFAARRRSSTRRSSDFDRFGAGRTRRDSCISSLRNILSLPVYFCVRAASELSPTRPCGTGRTRRHARRRWPRSSTGPDGGHSRPASGSGRLEAMSYRRPVRPAGTGPARSRRAPAATAPLAVRMRPRSLDEVVGQAHLLRPGAPLRRLVEGGAAASVLLYGPPGTGKTTMARLLAGAGEPALRRAVGALVGGPRAARGDRRRPAPPRPARPADRAVRRRGAPVLQDPAGRAARRRRGPPGAAGRRDDGEPVVLGRVAAALALAGAAAAVAHPTTTCAPCCAGPSPTPRGLGGAVTLAPEAEDALVRLATRRRAPRPDGAGGRRRRRRGHRRDEHGRRPRGRARRHRGDRALRPGTATSTTT